MKLSIQIQLYMYNKLRELIEDTIQLFGHFEIEYSERNEVQIYMEDCQIRKIIAVEITTIQPSVNKEK